MTKLRQTIARRLKDAQNTAAMLTTFNEVDMTAVMALRSQLQGPVREEARREARLHGLLREGLRPGAEGDSRRSTPRSTAPTSSTRTTTTSASRSGPTRASSCRWCATPTGCRSPGSRRPSREFGKRARDGQLKIEEMQGGTFTISNGGVYGSLMSTPILNAPQSGILGMHKIQDRPMVVGGKIEVRPMMYLALSYDHRIVDGKEAVTFLVRVKESLEDPSASRPRPLRSRLRRAGDLCPARRPRHVPARHGRFLLMNQPVVPWCEAAGRQAS
jgi:2-oxoglutarate dehydrogenase E2 component (dihydrolipoamide succinyltransferase)